MDPLEKVGPPLENVGPPLEPWKNGILLWNWPFDFCKINKLRTKKQTSELFFCQFDLDPPPPDENSLIRACTGQWIMYRTASYYMLCTKSVGTFLGNTYIYNKNKEDVQSILASATTGQRQRFHIRCIM